METNLETRPASDTQPDLFEKCYRYKRAEKAREEGIYPYFIPISGSEGTEVQIEGRTCIMIGSNNYLGLTHDPRVLEIAEKTARKYGTGCTGSRFLNGTLDLHEELEEKLARFVGRESALVFSTGFQSNLGILSCLLGRRDTIIMDKFAHASVVDGARQSGGEVIRYRHNDVDDYRSQLERVDRGRAIMLATDGAFSMEGDIAKLPELIAASQGYPVKFFVDEAHSLGVVGPTGAGACEQYGVIDQIDLIMGTFSKSFASIGGFISGTKPVIEYIKHHARTMIFSAAMPPYAVATVIKCLEIMQAEPERRQRLMEIQKKMNKEFRSLGFDTGNSETPIIPIIVGDFDLTLLFWRKLFDAGLFTNPVVAPAVPDNSNRLRTSFMATHTDEQLDRILSTMKRIGKELGII